MPCRAVSRRVPSLVVLEERLVEPTWTSLGAHGDVPAEDVLLDLVAKLQQGLTLLAGQVSILAAGNTPANGARALDDMGTLRGL